MSTEQVSADSPDTQWPPLLKQMLAEFAATGLPPAYLPLYPDHKTNEESS